MYIVRGLSAVTVGTINHVICQLWNPHATQRIRVVQFGVSKKSAAATEQWRLKRTTARGTPGSTVTPDIDNHSERAIAPVSGALLDLAAFTVQPTLSAGELGPEFATVGSTVSALIYDIPGGIVIPPGTGLAISQSIAAPFAAAVNHFVWYEE